ncbi:MAG TPA: MFS transporter, partial [Sphingobium sp.]
KSAQRQGGLAHVLKEPILWLSVAITVLGSFAYGAILTNEAALVDELAATRGWGSAAVSITALSALVGALVIGWFADRLKFLPLILIEISLLGAGVIGFLALYWVAFPAVLFISAICFGVAVGGFEAAVLPNMRRLLSTSHFDSAFGVWYLCYLGTLFAAPIGAGWIHDIYGSYAPALMILLGTTFAAFIPALLMPRRDA